MTLVKPKISVDHVSSERSFSILAEEDQALIVYRCTVCDDYDLCEKCALQGKTSKEHERNHPMEQIPPSDFARR